MICSTPTPRHRSAEFGLSAVVAHELFHGAYKSQRAENLAVVEALQFVVLDLDKEDANQAGEIRAALALAGQPIGSCDVLSAGQARAGGLTLITRDTAEFSRVEKLRIED